MKSIRHPCKNPIILLKCFQAFAKVLFIKVLIPRNRNQNRETSKKSKALKNALSFVNPFKSSAIAQKN